MAGPGKKGRRKNVDIVNARGLSALPALLKTMLEILPQVGTMAECARMMKVKYHQLSSLHRKRYQPGGDDPYSQAYDAALEESTQVLESEAMRRAVKGMRRLKFHKGEPILIPSVDADGNQILDNKGHPVLVPYVEDERSDLLLIFLLKARRPDIYRDHFKGEIQHSGEVGIQVSGVLAIERPAATSAEWEQQQQQQKVE